MENETSALLAEARRIAGRPSGALRLVLLRLRQERPEDAALRAALRRPVGGLGEESGLISVLRRFGYAPLRGRPRVWGRS
ncbi:MAG TPA: hypothetical protein VFC93_05785 [Chloroflexota bacterium]|nr:hypothetical protein [Chloroflexota bacterium]